ncbi:MAG: electron transfer flavoprotein subunit alpha/FixB family protein, partial [Desulfobacterales bacterium]|nr:electron transfer flavoprotein subunit alpha/FixB family protein [Desulfobacterales bacterium]
MAQDVLIITELWNDAFRKISLEAVSQGRRLADELGSNLTAVVLGDGAEAQAKELATYGADTIVLADDSALKTYRPCEYENVVAGIIEARSPGIVIFGATRQGRELSANVAARLDAGLAVECSGFSIEEGRLVATRTLYGGKVIATVDIDGPVQMASIRPNVFEIAEAEGAGKLETIAVDIGEV